ncbi:MAG TPA: arginine deiminase-related protein [Jatrophihabitans sp.]|nr:arginine deiminase-related protein [Jatrophihabitans sp.]
MSAPAVVSREAARPPRLATPRRYVLCPPTHFTLAQPINPWMTSGAVIDARRAHDQWRRLVDTYRGLGHDVELLAPAPGLPDMVFAANGGIVVGGRAFAANFAHPHRRAEADHHRANFARLGLSVAAGSAHVNEGEGDFLKAGDRILAGCGFRSARPAHDDLRAFFGLPVVSLTLVDPRFYHLDVALTVLDDALIAYFPPAFSPASVAVLEQLFPDAIRVDAADAERFACNAVSDGRHVVLDAQAERLAQQLRAAGFEPVPIEMSELRKSGGSVKCCTLELYR